ncbi:MAG: hypothetical protein AB1721_02460 [Patescibacteria group bacterium]
MKEKKGMKILTIGNSGTYEVEGFRLVEENLVAMGHQTVLFQQDRCLEDHFLTFEVRSGRPVYYIIAGEMVYDADEFDVIWYIHPHLPKELLEIEPPDIRPFIKKQFYSMRQGLWNIFRSKKWVNDPWNAVAAENKIWQLAVASEIGLSVPDTIITSDPERVVDFYNSHPEGIVVKLLGASPLVGRVIYTNIVSEEYLKEIQSVKLAPAIFQLMLRKNYELRITVVGNEMFPAKIYSQEDPRTTVDWRTRPEVNDFNVKMEQTVLPKFVGEQIKELMGRLGLRYGCIDMAVTPEGNYYFLEINPSGQWYFVQLKTGARIAEALAKLLVE